MNETCGNILLQDLSEISAAAPPPRAAPKKQLGCFWFSCKGPRSALTLASKAGFYGTPLLRVLSYSPAHMWHIFAPTELSVFNYKVLWIQSGFCVLLAIMVDVITPPDLGEAQEDRQAVVLLAADSLKGLVAFIVGGFVTNVVATWKQRRTNYASLIGTSRNLLIQISSIVALTTADAAAEEQAVVREMRATLGRYVLLACEIAILKARGEMDSAAARVHLLKERLVLPEEWDRMVQGDRHSTVYGWIQATCVALSRRGLIREVELSVICGAVSGARAQANDLMSSLDRDLPYPYAALVVTLVKLVMVIQSLVRWGARRVGGVGGTGRWVE